MSKMMPVVRYASSGGVVMDPTGEEVLVLLRPGRLGPDGQPEVRLPKGHIEHGESSRQTALREVREEAGLPAVEILADLGHQTVEFEWRDTHCVREESCFLMTTPRSGQWGSPEKQFERRWLTWDQALSALTFEAEREWVRRARAAGSKPEAS